MAFDPQKMDDAATEAENEFSELLGENRIDEESLDEIQAWWKKYVGRAGHKRLGRIILYLEPEQKPKKKKRKGR